MSGAGPQENLDVALGAAMAVLPGGLYALAVGVALIVVALRVRGLQRERGPHGVLNPRGGNE